MRKYLTAVACFAALASPATAASIVTYDVMGTVDSLSRITGVNAGLGLGLGTTVSGTISIDTMAPIADRRS
ncbi:MAG: hypothetical protein AAF908_11290 [Pseudomonadota bacterium]